MGNTKTKEVIVAQNASTGAEGYFDQRVHMLSITTLVIVMLATAVILHYLIRGCHAKIRKCVGKQIRNALPGQAQPGVAAQATGPQGVVFTA